MAIEDGQASSLDPRVNSPSCSFGLHIPTVLNANTPHRSPAVYHYSSEGEKRNTKKRQYIQLLPLIKNTVLMSTQLDIPEQTRVAAVYVKFASKPAIKIKVKKKKIE